MNIGIPVLIRIYFCKNEVIIMDRIRAEPDNSFYVAGETPGKG